MAKGGTKKQTVTKNTTKPVSDVDTTATVATEATTATDTATESKPVPPTYEEMYVESLRLIDESLNAVKKARRELVSMNKEHKRSLRKNTKVKQNQTDRKPRRPTTLFSQSLVDYIHNNLNSDDLLITRKEAGKERTTDLSKLDTSTPVHRTDVNKILKRVFSTKDMAKGVNIDYTKDSKFVELLTNGHPNEEEAKALKDGSFELNYFNINRFINKHLGHLSNDTTSTNTTSQ